MKREVQLIPRDNCRKFFIHLQASPNEKMRAVALGNQLKAQNHPERREEFLVQADHARGLCKLSTSESAVVAFGVSPDSGQVGYRPADAGRRAVQQIRHV